MHLLFCVVVWVPQPAADYRLEIAILTSGADILSNLKLIMQTVDEFMAEYFQARTSQLRSEEINRQPLRKRFFSKDCIWDSREGCVERSEREKVVSISTSGETTYIITDVPRPRPSLRYHLRQQDGVWQIVEVDSQCLACRDGIKLWQGCVCDGTGWMKPGSTKAHSGTPNRDNQRRFWRR